LYGNTISALNSVAIFLFICRSFMVSTSRKTTFMVEEAEMEAPITTKPVDTLVL
jgi:hypothetical protein